MVLGGYTGQSAPTAGLAQVGILPAASACVRLGAVARERGAQSTAWLPRVILQALSEDAGWNSQMGTGMGGTFGGGGGDYPGALPPVQPLLYGKFTVGMLQRGANVLLKTPPT